MSSDSAQGGRKVTRPPAPPGADTSAGTPFFSDNPRKRPAPIIHIASPTHKDPAPTVTSPHSPPELSPMAHAAAKELHPEFPASSHAVEMPEAEASTRHQHRTPGHRSTRNGAAGGSGGGDDGASKSFHSDKLGRRASLASRSRRQGGGGGGGSRSSYSDQSGKHASDSGFPQGRRGSLGSGSTTDFEDRRDGHGSGGSDIDASMTGHVSGGSDTESSRRSASANTRSTLGRNTRPSSYGSPGQTRSVAAPSRSPGMISIGSEARTAYRRPEPQSRPGSSSSSDDPACRPPSLPRCEAPQNRLPPPLYQFTSEAVSGDGRASPRPHRKRVIPSSYAHVFPDSHRLIRGPLSPVPSQSGDESSSSPVMSPSARGSTLGRARGDSHSSAGRPAQSYPDFLRRSSHGSDRSSGSSGSELDGLRHETDASADPRSSHAYSFTRRLPSSHDALEGHDAGVGAAHVLAGGYDAHTGLVPAKDGAVRYAASALGYPTSIGGVVAASAGRTADAPASSYPLRASDPAAINLDHLPMPLDAAAVDAMLPGHTPSAGQAHDSAPFSWNYDDESGKAAYVSSEVDPRCPFLKQSDFASVSTAHATVADTYQPPQVIERHGSAAMVVVNSKPAHYISPVDVAVSTRPADLERRSSCDSASSHDLRPTPEAEYHAEEHASPWDRMLRSKCFSRVCATVMAITNGTIAYYYSSDVDTKGLLHDLSLSGGVYTQVIHPVASIAGAASLQCFITLVTMHLKKGRQARKTQHRAGINYRKLPHIPVQTLEQEKQAHRNENVHGRVAAFFVCMVTTISLSSLLPEDLDKTLSHGIILQVCAYAAFSLCGIIAGIAFWYKAAHDIPLMTRHRQLLATRFQITVGVFFAIAQAALSFYPTEVALQNNGLYSFCLPAWLAYTIATINAANTLPVAFESRVGRWIEINNKLAVYPLMDRLRLANRKQRVIAGSLIFFMTLNMYATGLGLMNVFYNYLSKIPIDAWNDTSNTTCFSIKLALAFLPTSCFIGLGVLYFNIFRILAEWIPIDPTMKAKASRYDINTLLSSRQGVESTCPEGIELGQPHTQPSPPSRHMPTDKRPRSAPTAQHVNRQRAGLWAKRKSTGHDAPTPVDGPQYDYT